MINNKPKLSIIAAVYNLEKYLPRCLDSLVNQTLQDIEILCVDDGSIDSAPQIIDEYAKKYPNKIKAFHKENGGEFTTRNYGFERATGEYVTFVDTDDYVETKWAEKLYNAASRNVSFGSVPVFFWAVFPLQWKGVVFRSNSEFFRIGNSKIWAL